MYTLRRETKGKIEEVVCRRVCVAKRGKCEKKDEERGVLSVVDRRVREVITSSSICRSLLRFSPTWSRGRSGRLTTVKSGRTKETLSGRIDRVDWCEGEVVGSV